MINSFFLMVAVNAQEKKIADYKETISLNFSQESCETYLENSREAYNKADYEEFKKYNDSALMVAQKFNLKALEIKAVINQGIYYNMVDAYKKALEQFYKALALNDEAHNKEITKVNILVNLANVYSQIDAPDKVIDCMKEVLDLSDKNEVSSLIKLAAYNGLGNSYTIKKDYKTALSYLYKMKIIGEQMNNVEAIHTALDNIGYSYYQQEKWDEVIKTAEESLAYSEIYGVGKRPVALLNMGMSYVKKVKPEVALPYLKEALDAAITRNDLELKKEAHRHLAKAYKLMGDFEKSNKEQELYAEMMKGLLKEQSNAALLDLKHEGDAEKKIVESQLKSLAAIDNNKSKALVGGGVAIVLLGGMLFFYIRKKKAAEIDKERFKVTNALLHNENKALKTKLMELADKKEKNINTTAQYKNSSLTEQDRDHYMKLILDYMEKEKPYLDFDINQSELASKLTMSRHHLSEVLSLCFDQNFYHFINLYRVNEAQKIMKNPDYKDYKILAIAYESGFKSKTSFNRVFKNHTGLTPSEFRKNKLI